MKQHKKHHKRKKKITRYTKANKQWQLETNSILINNVGIHTYSTFESSFFLSEKNERISPHKKKEERKKNKRTHFLVQLLWLKISLSPVFIAIYPHRSRTHPSSISSSDHCIVLENTALRPFSSLSQPSSFQQTHHSLSSHPCQYLHLA